jgi:hypothetical protein
MKARKPCALAVVMVLAGGTALRAGLYDDEKKATTGDIKDLDYWHAKFYHMEFEAALKSHQPEYLVGQLVAIQKRTVEDLLKKYPNHEDLKKWATQYDDVEGKIDKNADRTAHWKPEFEYWENEAYRQAWVNMNLGKMEEEAKDWPSALGRYRWAAENFGKMTDHPEWMKNWPEEITKWVKATQPEAEKKVKEMKAKQ